MYSVIINAVFSNLRRNVASAAAIFDPHDYNRDEDGGAYSRMRTTCDNYSEISNAAQAPLE